MDATRRYRWIGFLCLGVTAFGWALNWPLMKLLLQEWPPLFARGLAGVASSLILFSIAWGRRQSLHVPREAIPRLLFASFTNVFAWMGFGTVAMKFVPVGEGALIVYTMPIWATLLAWPLAGIRPTLTDAVALISASAASLSCWAPTVSLSTREKSSGSHCCSPRRSCSRSATSSIATRCRCRRSSWSHGRSGSAAW